jgi:hypothetical protein
LCSVSRRPIWAGTRGDNLLVGPGTPPGVETPTTALLGNKVEFKWTQKCQEAFEALKEKLTTAPVLVSPDVHKPFSVYCDACYTGLGCVLMQEGRVVAYSSR